MTQHRNTQQRKLILELVAARRDHPTADEIYLAVQTEHPHISRGTVYRNLNLLADRGDILHVPIAGGADRFDSTTKPHYHLFCRSCGRVCDVDTPYRAELDAIPLPGGEIDGHQILFYGLCVDCKQEAKEG